MRQQQLSGWIQQWFSSYMADKNNPNKPAHLFQTACSRDLILGEANVVLITGLFQDSLHKKTSTNNWNQKDTENIACGRSHFLSHHQVGWAGALQQWFPTGGTRTPRGTQAHCRGYVETFNNHLCYVILFENHQHGGTHGMTNRLRGYTRQKRLGNTALQEGQSCFLLWSDQLEYNTERESGVKQTSSTLQPISRAFTMHFKAKRPLLVS